MLVDLALRTTLYVHSLTYRVAGILATMKEGNGMHPKHRIMNYHQFFIGNIESNDTVLDIGCGNGALTADLASKASWVIGMDINKDRINYAKEHNMRDNIKYYHGDADSLKVMTLALSQHYDVVVMSNVLEHIDMRAQFLEFWGRHCNKLLLRVPMLDRGWLPVYMMELGIDYRLDPDHRTEYTLKTLQIELKVAGLRLESYEIRYGELWGVAIHG